ncbi:unnamed protein product [Coffea canephora]|uniref:C2 NT-type domain-containing protein n=1 Tax=Coffea canephora TaxID=49390 RepID=A0A068V479_COFCA|nr:unnamed protein product [Coffea canephora]
MFKLQRQNHRPSKSGERVDFKFSNFQALQVPKGWDRLFLSMTSVESGKTVARLGKALVRNGNCQWTETLLESVWITKDDSSKEPEECLFKLVVSMGSSRAGILGEATINVSCLMSSKASSAVILPLRKCNFETLLQPLASSSICLQPSFSLHLVARVKIQCLTPRPNIRHGSPNSNFKRQNEDVDFQALSSTSETADNSLVRSSKVSSSQDLDVSSHHENHKQDQNYSGVNSNHNANYAEGSKRRDPFNPMHKLQSNGYTTHQRHIGASSKSSSAHDNYPVDDSSFSSQSSCNSGVMNSKMDLHSSGKESGNASPRNTGSKDLLEAAEGTIEELRVEAKMWERNARKLMLDLDMLRKEFLGQSKKQSDLVMELSAAYAEHSGLKKEIEQLNVMLEESTLKQRALEDSVLQSEGQTQIQEELESELKYHQQSNANLSLQLKRSQESNIELVSILQELEHTIEQQKIEIENLSALHLKSADRKMLEIDVQRLEKALEEKVNELETQRSLNGQSLLDMEREQCAAFESSGLFCELLKQLELAFHCLMKPLPNVSPHASEKCKFILDDVANLSKKDSSNSKVFTESILNYFSELNNILEDRIAEFEQTIRCGEIEIQKRNDAITEAHKSVEDMILKVQQHEISKAELEADCQSLLKELSQKRSEMDKLQADLLSKEGQTNFHIQRQRELEIQVADLQTEKVQLEMNNETIEREHEVTSKCLDDLQNDFAVLSSRLDSHVSAKEILERKLAELELEKRNLEKKIILLEDEKLQLQERISVMDVQMTQLGDEQQSCRLELKDSKSLAMNLQNQIRRLEIEMEAHNVSFNQNIQDKQDQLLESQRHCECLRAENQDLQASILRLGEERKILQKLNKELKKKELELHEHSEQMATRLENSEKCFSDCTRKVEALEENLNSTLEAFTLKEKSLNSELEAILQECRNEKEKLVLQETLSNQMHFEMSSEVKNLQKEVESLMTQISVAHEEKEKAESEASLEIASLNADKRKLEFALQEVNSKLELSEPSRRTTEEKLKTALNNIELKLTLSDYENQQLREESANLKVHFQRVADLQHEVSVLKSKVEECRFEKEKLEASYQTVSGDYESLKAEKNSCVEKVLSLQKAMTDYEDCKQKAIALEEKLLQMEGALLSKETLSAQNADLEKELNEVRKVSKQYQQIISQLEEQKSECLLKVQALEMDVLKRHNCDRKCDGKCSMKDGSPRPGEVADELAEALDEDNMHKIQLHSFSSEELSSETMACSKISVVESQAEARERFERTKSSLETELRDLRERYLEMSLKYAEVEAQREDLVMKLKAAKSGKRWFS